MTPVKESSGVAVAGIATETITLADIGNQVLGREPLTIRTAPTARFEHPLMHVIDADKHRVLWRERHTSTTWLPDRARITRGEQTYKVVAQQPEVENYYVWVRKEA